MLRVTDLRQWEYCRRVVYYQRVMPGVGKATYKMAEGLAAQDMIERLEARRTLGRYGWLGARRETGVWLEDERLGLAGKADMLLVAGGEAAVVEFKLTSGEPGPNHWMQLAAYGVLVESKLSLLVKELLLYRIPDDAVFARVFDDARRVRVCETLGAIRGMVESQEIPSVAADHVKCHECEYANFCGDVW